MENITNKATDNIELQIAKLEEIKRILSRIKNHTQQCYNYDYETGNYTDEVVDEVRFKACTAIYNDICKLYKLGDC